MLGLGRGGKYEVFRSLLAQLKRSLSKSAYVETQLIDYLEVTCIGGTGGHGCVAHKDLGLLSHINGCK